jgi:rhamnulokinase
MKNRAKFIAADLGASSGRVMAGLWDGERFGLKELHRFGNGGIKAGDGLHWDVQGIWTELLEGLRRYRTCYSDAPSSIAVDAWGVDFGLLDAAGNLLNNPFHYRDGRTSGMPARLFKKVPESTIFSETGTQTMEINTIFQLFSMVQAEDAVLHRAATLLMIPDLFHYFLCGAKAVEYTEATTTQMYSLSRRCWAHELLVASGLPSSLLPEVIAPGTILGLTKADVLERGGLWGDVPVIAVASHDTASAVAAIPEMDAESVFISSGTWSLIGIEAQEPQTSDSARRQHFTNEGGADGGVLVLKNITGLWVLQECQRHWKTMGEDYTWDEIVEAASRAPALVSIFDPNDDRLQVPSDMPGAIRRYCAETKQILPQTVGEIARCAFESLCLKYRTALGSLQSLTGRRFQTIRIVGGGAINPVLSQMTADACDRLVVAGPVEASALGNVMLQAIAMGHVQDIHAGRTALAASVERLSYEPHRSAAWDDVYARFKGLEVD